MNDFTTSTAEEQDEAMIYARPEPNVQALQEAYAKTLIDLDYYFDNCSRSYDDRRNIWNGKSSDMRKHGANAFPWEGASDTEVNVIGERIDTYTALFAQALERSHIKAFATSPQAMAKSSTVSAFLKWMRKHYIPNFKKHMEQGGSNLLEKGLMITYVGWQAESRTYRQSITLDQIIQEMPEVAEAIVAGGQDDELVEMFKQQSPAITDKKAKKAIRELRAVGVTEISVPRRSVDRPIVNSCSPDRDIFFPSYVSDPQKSPYIFYRDFLTAQDLEKKVTSDGWDADWVDEAIEKLRGQDNSSLVGERQTSSDRLMVTDDKDLVMVIYCYQRLIDEEDGSEGIYCTVMHPDTHGYAKHELLNGHDDYPFVVTALNQNEARMYDTKNFADFLRGAQYQIKTERDSRTDRASLATLPPLMHPVGRPPTAWGPGARVPYRRLGELAFGPTPPNDMGSREIEAASVQQADKAVGLDMENPLAGVRQQFFVDKFLEHCRDVLDMAFRLYLRMGPEEVAFQVTGDPNMQVMNKGMIEDAYDINVSFDTKETDPENMKTQFESIVSILPYDANGRIDMDKFIELAVGTINPFYADYMLRPAEQSQQDLMKDVTDDLAKVFAGIEVPSRPNGAQGALSIIQGYVQQPDVAARLEADETFAGRLQKYAGGYEFQMQQAQNAEIGRLGVAPAEMGGVRTQGMAQ